MKHLIILYSLLLIGCSSNISQKIYPTGIGSNVFKVGQVYESINDLSFYRSTIISNWKDNYENNKYRDKIPSKTQFQITKVKRKFDGSIGWHLDIEASFYLNEVKKTGVVSSYGHGISKPQKGIKGFSVYITPNRNNIKLIE